MSASKRGSRIEAALQGVSFYPFIAEGIGHSTTQLDISCLRLLWRYCFFISGLVQDQLVQH